MSASTNQGDNAVLYQAINKNWNGQFSVYVQARHHVVDDPSSISGIISHRELQGHIKVTLLIRDNYTVLFVSTT